MKKKSVLSALGLCFILPCFFLLSACTKTPPTEPEEPAEPIKLNAPVVSLNDNIASWTSVENATSYEVWIDLSTDTVAITITQQTLTDGQSFKVRAVGDGSNYLTSNWSNTVTYTATNTPPVAEPTELSAPVVSIDEDGIASWSAVANASGYKYKINNGTEQSTTSTSVQLSDGDSIVVKAVGNGTTYSDSAYSESKTYTAPIPPLEPTELSAPVVNINESGLATWNVVANANGYKYKINNGTEQSTTSTSVQLTNGDSIIVKAVGDGVEYADSNYSASKTYTAPAEPTELSAPVVSIDEDGITSWNAVANASGYKYKINDGTEQSTTSTSVQLSDGDSIIVKAVGDGEEFLDSAFCSAVTFNTNLIQLSAPIISIDSSGKAVWNWASSSIGFVYRINNGIEQTTGRLAVDRVAQLSNGDTIIVKALGNGTTHRDSNYSESVMYTTPITPTNATYTDIVSAIETNLNAYIQSSYNRGTIKNAKVFQITSNGTLICFYNLGSADMLASIQITGLSTATTFNEAYTIVSSTTNYGAIENKTDIQPTEDTLAIIETTMKYSTSSTYYTYEQLNGYSVDDIVWATSTPFSSGRSTTVTLVLKDGTMVKYSLNVMSTSSSSAKAEYIAGCGHSIGNISSSEYQSLEDKLNNVGDKVFYSDVFKKIISKLTDHVTYYIKKATNIKLVNISSSGEVYITYTLDDLRFGTSFIIQGLGSATTLEEAFNIVDKTYNYGQVSMGGILYNIVQTDKIIVKLIENGIFNSVKTFTFDDISDLTITKLTKSSTNNYKTTCTIFFDDNTMLTADLKVYTSSNADTAFINGTVTITGLNSQRGYDLRYKLDN